MENCQSPDNKKMSNKASLVKVYSGRLCAYCTAAKRLLDKKGIQYEEIMVDTDTAIRAEMERLSNRQTIPQIFIGDTHVGGYDDLAELHHSGELDKLLIANKE